MAVVRTVWVDLVSTLPYPVFIEYFNDTICINAYERRRLDSRGVLLTSLPVGVKAISVRG